MYSNQKQRYRKWLKYILNCKKSVAILRVCVYFVCLHQIKVYAMWLVWLIYAEHSCLKQKHEIISKINDQIVPKHNETDWQDTIIDHFKGKDLTVRLKITPQLSRMLLPLMGSQLIDVMIDSSVHLWSCYNDHRDSKPMKCFFKAFNLVEQLTV